MKKYLFFKNKTHKLIQKLNCIFFLQFIFQKKLNKQNQRTHHLNRILMWEPL